MPNQVMVQMLNATAVGYVAATPIAMPHRLGGGGLTEADALLHDVWSRR
jgi:hypothetical protein